MKQIKISKKTKLKEIQEWFSKSFPGLNLKFYKVAHSKNEGSPKNWEITNNPNLEELNKCISLNLMFDKSYKVSEVEEVFENVFGLHAQVLRKSGKIWLQTTKTDDLTLKEQMDLSLEYA